MKNSHRSWFGGCGSRLFLTLLLAAAVVLQAACAGKPEKPPLKLILEIAASGDLNPGPGGQPLPVVLRLYQLKQQGTFMGADFYSLFDKESSVLGPDLVSREEVTLRPSQVLQIQRTLDPAVTAVGVLAAYQAIDRSRWRAVIGLKPGVDNTLRIIVAAEAVSAEAK